jgi:hypothetical protein
VVHAEHYEYFIHYFLFGPGWHRVRPVAYVIYYIQRTKENQQLSLEVRVIHQKGSQVRVHNSAEKEDRDEVEVVLVSFEVEAFEQVGVLLRQDIELLLLLN